MCCAARDTAHAIAADEADTEEVGAATAVYHHQLQSDQGAPRIGARPRTKSGIPMPGSSGRGTISEISARIPTRSTEQYLTKGSCGCRPFCRGPMMHESCASPIARRASECFSAFTCSSTGGCQRQDTLMMLAANKRFSRVESAAHRPYYKMGRPLAGDPGAATLQFCVLSALYLLPNAQSKNKSKIPGPLTGRVGHSVFVVLEFKSASVTVLIRSHFAYGHQSSWKLFGREGVLRSISTELYIRTQWITNLTDLDRRCDIALQTNVRLSRCSRCLVHFLSRTPRDPLEIRQVAGSAVGIYIHLAQA